jgi:hypothetical protein
MERQSRSLTVDTKERALKSQALRKQMISLVAAERRANLLLAPMNALGR